MSGANGNPKAAASNNILLKRRVFRSKMSESPAQRKNNGRRRFHRRPAKEDGPEATKTEREDRPPRVDVPVPRELIGKSATGTIDSIIGVKGQRPRFGFIAIDGSEARIYFNMAAFDKSEFLARRGYDVEFSVEKDDKDRAFATNIKLTAAGKAQAVEKEAKIAELKASNPREPRERKAPATAAAPEAAAGEATEKKRRVRVPREKSAEDDRSVSLQFTCAGHAETKTVEAKLFQSIGKLKHAAIEAFGASPSLVIYCNATSANPQGEMMTKALLRQLHDNDTVHLREAPAATA